MNRLRELRIKKNLSLRKLSEFVQIDYSALSKAETGKRNLNNDDLERLTKFFNVSSDYILGFTDNPNIITNIEKKGIDAIIENELHNLDNDSKEDLLTYIKFLKAKGEL